MKKRFASLTLILFFSGILAMSCKEKSAPQSSLPSPGPAVTRASVLETAQAYFTHRWIADSKNQFHGLDADGIRVDTPDAESVLDEGHGGWWTTEDTNVGLPYQWGGFSSLEEFDEGLKQGKFAGDIYTAEKRRQLDDAVSKHAVGVDCSGFVSRCWKLPRSYSTRELPDLCDELPTYDDLLPGDILNTHNGHVVLFVQWVDDARSQIEIYEAGSVPHRKVLNREVPVADLKKRAFRPYRYKNIQD